MDLTTEIELDKKRSLIRSRSTDRTQMVTQTSQTIPFPIPPRSMSEDRHKGEQDREHNTHVRTSKPGMFTSRTISSDRNDRSPNRLDTRSLSTETRTRGRSPGRSRTHDMTKEFANLSLGDGKSNKRKADELEEAPIYDVPQRTQTDKPLPSIPTIDITDDEQSAEGGEKVEKQKGKILKQKLNAVVTMMARKNQQQYRQKSSIDTDDDSETIDSLPTDNQTMTLIQEDDNENDMDSNDDKGLSLEQQIEYVRNNTGKLRELYEELHHAYANLEEEREKHSENLRVQSEEFKTEIEILSNIRDEYMLRRDKDMADREKELKMIREEMNEMNSLIVEEKWKTETLTQELTKTKAALYQTNLEKTDIIEQTNLLKLEVTRKHTENERLSLKNKKLTHDMGNLLQAVSEGKARNSNAKGLSHLIAEQNDQIRLGEENLNRAISNLSLAQQQDDTPKSTILMLEGEDAEDRVNTPDLHAPPLDYRDSKKAIKDYTWPVPSTYDCMLTFERMFRLNVDEARKEGIEEGVIKTAIQQHLMKSHETSESFAKYAQECDKNKRSMTIDGILKSIASMDPITRSLTAEEKYAMLKVKADEMAVKYMDRCESTFDDTFKGQTVGRRRRIVKQFLDGFVKDHLGFNAREKELLGLHTDLTDLALAAETKMREKLDEKMRMIMNAGKPNYPKPPTLQTMGRTPNKQINVVEGNEGNATAPQTTQPQQYQQQPYQQVQQHQQYQRPQQYQQYQQRQYQQYQQPQQQQKEKKKFETAEPNAVRVTLEEYRRGRTNEGGPFCGRCLQKGEKYHHPLDCRNFVACAHCMSMGLPAESMHGTNYHTLWAQDKQIQVDRVQVNNTP